MHATGESLDARHADGTYAIVLAVPDEQALRAVAARLKLARVQHVEIHEPDPPWNGALTALGLAPARKEALRRYLSSLPRLK